jgi:hypothetical protein
MHPSGVTPYILLLLMLLIYHTREQSDYKMNNCDTRPNNTSHNTQFLSHRLLLRGRAQSRRCYSHNYTAEKKLLHKLRARKSYDLSAKFAAGRNGST